MIEWVSTQGRGMPFVLSSPSRKDVEVMVTLVTWTSCTDCIRQAVSQRDPADIYKEMELCVANATVKSYSLITLKSHALAGD